MLTNLISVKGYEAGSKGNLLVSLDKDLRLNIVGDKSVNLMICVAEVTDKEALDSLEEYVDETTPFDKVIVVNDKFMKLSSKQQLALLKWENEKVKTPADGVNERIDVVADVMTARVYGRAGRSAIKKVTNYRLRNEKTVGKELNKDYKKELREEKKLKKGVARASKLFRRRSKKDATENVAASATA